MTLRNIRILLLALLALEVALLIFGPPSSAPIKDKWWADAVAGIRYAAGANAVLLVLLLVISKWWVRWLRPAPVSTPQAVAAPTPRWFWPLLVIAVITCLGLRLPLASKSLWWDESWVMHQVVHGKWRPDTKNPGQFKFQEHDWKRCVFYYQKPTNHVPMALAQKLSLKVWQRLTGAKPGEFSYLAARMPALLASGVAVLLLALLLRSWGAPGAGVLAASLLALHPWHIRYGVDARAYALVIPLCIAGMFALSRIMQTRGSTLLPWVGWGFVEFLWLWAYPNAVVEVAVFTAVLAVALWRDKERRSAGLGCLCATNVFAAMALAQVFLPNLMQALQWAGSENVAQPVTLDLIRSTLSQLVFGVEWLWPGTPEALGLVSSAGGQAPLIGWWTWPFIALMLLILVIFRVFTGGKVTPRAWIIVLAPLFSTILFIVGKAVTQSYFYPRFVIAALPALVASIALLFAEAASANRVVTGPLHAIRRNMAWVFGVIIVLFVVPCWFAQAQLLLTRPYAPLQEVAAKTEEYLKQSGEKPALLVCYGHGYEILPLYLRDVRPALSRAELENFIAQARSEGRALLVIQGHSVHNRASIPDGFTLLDNPNLFEQKAAFAGIEPEFYFRIFQLK